MSEEAPKRTFPKKASSFASKPNKFKKKFREASVGGTVLKKRPKRYFKADLTEDGDAVVQKRSRRAADITKINRNGKHHKVAFKGGKKKGKGEPVKGTSIDHQMLGGSEDEMYASDNDIVDVTDMLEDEDTMIPMVNSMKKQGKSVRCDEIRRKGIAENQVAAPGKSSQTDVSKMESSYEEDIEKRSVDRRSLRRQSSSDSDNEDDPRPTRKLKVANGDGSESESEQDKQQIKRRKKLRKNEETTMETEAWQDEDDGGQGQDQDDAEAFRSEMADLPLFKVREMKAKLGIKLFNKVYFGKAETEKKLEENKKRRIDAKKDEHRGQHRPKEISSKKPVSTFRPVYQNITKKKRDPRFDSRAGEFKERCFDDNYHFLEELKKEEREELSREAAACDERGETETAERIRETIRRMDNREKTKAERRMKQETLKELRQENIDRMMRGEKPVFKTKAQVKIMNLEKKFKQLKKDNKLDKYMKRKAKKEAHKESNAKPSFERMYGYQ
ncbi:hypothetical protein RB195_015686 [Necator americanus]|uniref:rRNA biogenesis protein RRP36 n=2 Tax=Necator americanus TaxID=51031 RepID=A0ABR1E5U0_NECAM